MHGYGDISCRHSTVECECDNVRLTFVYCFNDVINALTLAFGINIRSLNSNFSDKFLILLHSLHISFLKLKVSLYTTVCRFAYGGK